MTGTTTIDLLTHRAPAGTDEIMLFPDGKTTIAELAVVPTVKAVTFGADPTGTTDSGPAINAAIAALPVSGGNVWIGPGNFKISTTIQIGDGSTAGVSTRTGVELIGSAAAAGVGPALSGMPGPNGANGICHLFSGAAVDMLHVNGPLNGWGLHNIDFDGAFLGLVGLTEVSCQGGFSSGCIVRHFMTCQQLTRALPGIGALSGFNNNHMHNRYNNFAMQLPGHAGTIGIWCKGNGSGTDTNSCFDIWDDLVITGVTGEIGIKLGWVDTQAFRNVHFASANGVNPIGQAILFDYTAEAANLPADNYFERVNFNTSAASVFNLGTPSGSPAANHIVFIAAANSRPSDPSLANLNWGVTASNP